MFRDSRSILGVLGEALFFSIVLGFVFWQIPEDPASGVRSRLTLTQMAMNGQPYVLMTIFIYLFSKDIAIFDADRAENAHGVASWLLAQFLTYIPFTVVAPLIFIGILYAMSGMRAGFTYWIYWAVVHILTVLSYWSLGLMCVAATRLYDKAALMANSLASIPGFASGFILQTTTIPVWLIWTKYISSSFWAFQISVLTEFRDRKFPCPVPDQTSPLCSAYDGNNIIYQVGNSPQDAIGIRIGVMILIVLVQICLTAVFLHTVQVDTELAGQATATPLKTKSKKSLQENGTSIDLEQGLSRGSLPEAERTDVRIEGAKLSVIRHGLIPGSKPTSAKILLDDITTSFKSGNFSAVLGTGSSGKTTLLNYVLRARYPATLFQRYVKEGRVVYNEEVDPSLLALTSLVGFVRKDNDAIFPFLTVRETLQYAARLRLWNVSDFEKDERVNEIIRVLGLKDCANTQVGNPMVKGISGGEKRRLNIGLGMICNPKVLIIDEATTGLDSSAAQIVARTLHNIAKSGRTVVITSQQTRSEIFELFDRIVVLSGGGRVAYQGDRPGMLQFFEEADYIIDVTSVDLRDSSAEKESRGRVDQIVAKFRERTQAIPDQREVNDPDRVDVVIKTEGPTFSGAPFTTAYVTLMRRNILNLQRRSYEFFDKIMLPGGLALIVMVFFSNRLQHDFISIQNRLGLLFQVPAVVFIGLIATVAYYPQQRSVFYREYADGAYNALPFFLAHFTIELPTTIVGSLLFAVLAGIVPGIQISEGRFFLYWLVSGAFLHAGESMALLILSLVDDIGLGIVVASVISSSLVSMCGVGAVNLPRVLDVINHASPLRWGIHALTTLEFTGLTFSCKPTLDQAYPDGTCIYQTGEQVLEQIVNMAGERVWFDILILLIIVVLLRILAFGALKYRLRSLR
ncbi:hypothetical protein HDU93_004987 [Gonapodya sp. JEL0774]|nr:hypothetical protein HDU93_004987 [Gonapodya sp. JEL0774]